MGCTAVLTLAILLVALSPAAASAAEGVACTTIEINDTHYVTVLEKDPGLGVNHVGHFLWLQNTDYPDSLNNIVSLNRNPYQWGDIVRVCTDGIRGNEVISTGDTAAAETVTDTGKHVVYSTDLPHPQVVEEWVRVENGWLIK